MKKLLIYIAIACCATSVMAQDSLVIVNAKWQKQKIAPGATLKTVWFNNKELFGSNQNISVLEVKPKRKLYFDIGAEGKTNIPTSSFGSRSGALAALNGTFFDIANGGSVDYIRVDNSVVNTTRINGGKRAGHQMSAVVIDKGKLDIIKWNGQNQWEETITAEDVMVSGPLLILDRQEEKLDSNSFNVTRHPRTAVVVTRNNRVLLVTVDGRHENAAGMSLFELTKLARLLGADDAINLDGGGSTTLWTARHGVINYPTDNKQWDHAGERKVANVVLLKKK